MTESAASSDAVKRFTTEYIIVEDRIRLSLERENGGLLVLWLTRRLAARLVKHLAKVIDTLPKLQGKAQAVPPTDNIQRRNQLDALGQIEQQAPVLAGSLPDDIEAHLVIEVGLRLTKAGALIDLKGSNKEVIQTLPFNEAAIRQWLAVLHVCFDKAGWDDDIWPSWITSKGWDQGPDALRLN